VNRSLGHRDIDTTKIAYAVPELNEVRATFDETRQGLRSRAADSTVINDVAKEGTGTLLPRGSKAILVGIDKVMRQKQDIVRSQPLGILRVSG
jgi:hypothetical protein